MTLTRIPLLLILALATGLLAFAALGMPDAASARGRGPGDKAPTSTWNIPTVKPGEINPYPQLCDVVTLKPRGTFPGGTITLHCWDTNPNTGGPTGRK